MSTLDLPIFLTFILTPLKNVTHYSFQYPACYKRPDLPPLIDGWLGEKSGDRIPFLNL